MSRGTEAKPAAQIPNTTPELEVRHEVRDVMRIIALQVGSFDEVKFGMFPKEKEIKKIFNRSMTSEMAVRLFKQMYSSSPYLTRMIWEFKVGGKSPNMYILPGGGGLDVPDPSPEQILLGSLLELSDETGHTFRNARIRSDCNRQFGFNMRDGNTITQRRNHESLVVAYIPRGQSTRRRFIKTENIAFTARFTIEQVSHLLKDEEHLSPPHRGKLIDNLCLNQQRHAEYGVILDVEETKRTRTAIETEMWVYEASMWKRLALALLKKQPNKVRGTFRTEMHSIMTTEDPTDIDSATILMGSIRQLLPKIEQHCKLSKKQKNRTKKDTNIQMLLKSGIPENVIFKRLALIQKIEIAYKEAFHTKKRRKKTTYITQTSSK